MAPRWKRVAKRLVKIGLAVLVLLALGRHVQQTWEHPSLKVESIRVDPFWIVLAGVLYLAGLTAFGIFFGHVMKASRSPVPLYAAVRAYLISHLGKYVPGKAMVVITRVGLSTPFGARPATAALATFYETLVMMAGGALIASVGFAPGIGTKSGALSVLLSLGLAVGFLLTVEPRIFPWLAGKITSPFPTLGIDAMPSLSRRLLLEGLGWSILGWTLLGLSQVAVSRAIAPAGIDPKLWPLVIGSVALATVAGFVVAILPAGFGVREGVLITTLTPAMGADMALVSTLVLRLTWVAAEAIAAGVVTAIRPRRVMLESTNEIEIVEPGTP